MPIKISTTALPINIPLLDNLIKGLLESGGLPITEIELADPEGSNELATVQFHFEVDPTPGADGVEKDGVLNLVITGENLSFVGPLTDDHEPIPHKTRLGGIVETIKFSGSFGKADGTGPDTIDPGRKSLFHEIPTFPHEDHGSFSDLLLDFTNGGTVSSNLTFSRFLTLFNVAPPLAATSAFNVLPQFIHGTASADTISGGTTSDIIRSEGGADLVAGNDGADVLALGNGSDTGFGGAGADTLYGVEGNDWLLGEKGDDVIYGQSGYDSLLGGDGDDSLLGNAGNDAIDGGAGDDTIIGGDDRDLVNGGDGDDFINGGNQGDTIDGGAGDDTVDGGAGYDLVGGGTGADSLIGLGGHDTIAGGLHDDTISGGLHEDSLYGDFGHLPGAPLPKQFNVTVGKETLKKINAVPDDFVFFDGFKVHFDLEVPQVDHPNFALIGGIWQDATKRNVPFEDIDEVGDQVILDPGAITPGEGLTHGNISIFAVGHDQLTLPDGSNVLQIDNGSAVTSTYTVTPVGDAAVDAFSVTLAAGETALVNIGEVDEAVTFQLSTGGEVTQNPNAVGSTPFAFKSTLIVDDHVDLTLDDKLGLDGHLSDALFPEVPEIDDANLADLLGLGDYDGPDDDVRDGFTRIDTFEEFFALYLNGGNDIIDAGNDDDFADGGAGNDSVAGGSGADTLLGGTGADTIVGGTGDDRLAGDVDFIKFIPEDKHAVFSPSLLPPGRPGKDKTPFAGADDFVFEGTDFGDDVIIDFQVGLDLIHIVDGFTASDLEEVEFGRTTVILEFENAAGVEAEIRLENMSNDPSAGPLFNPDLDIIFS